MILMHALRKGVKLTVESLRSSYLCVLFGACKWLHSSRIHVLWQWQSVHGRVRFLFGDSPELGQKVSCLLGLSFSSGSASGPGAGQNSSFVTWTVAAPLASLWNFTSPVTFFMKLLALKADEADGMIRVSFYDKGQSEGFRNKLWMMHYRESRRGFEACGSA